MAYKATSKGKVAPFDPIPEIDHWLRRRMRMCYWKQWRRFRTRVRNLLKLGTHPRVAIPLCFSRKGPWRCARTLATQTGMTNQWLKDQGLLSVKELWVNTCPPQEDSLPDYGPVGSVNRLVRLPASGGDPHATSKIPIHREWCGEGS